MIKSRILSQFDVKNYTVIYDTKNFDLKIAVCGVFDSVNIHWEYYAISFISGNNFSRLTADLTKSTSINSTFSFDVSNVKGYFRKFENQHEAEAFLNDFKLKWETGSNNTSQVIRDEKLNKILDGNV